MRRSVQPHHSPPSPDMVGEPLEICTYVAILFGSWRDVSVEGGYKLTYIYIYRIRSRTNFPSHRSAGHHRDRVVSIFPLPLAVSPGLTTLNSPQITDFDQVCGFRVHNGGPRICREWRQSCDGGAREWRYHHRHCRYRRQAHDAQNPMEARHQVRYSWVA